MHRHTHVVHRWPAGGMAKKTENIFSPPWILNDRGKKSTKKSEKITHVRLKMAVTCFCVLINQLVNYITHMSSTTLHSSVAVKSKSWGLSYTAEVIFLTSLWTRSWRSWKLCFSIIVNFNIYWHITAQNNHVESGCKQTSWLFFLHLTSLTFQYNLHCPVKFSTLWVILKPILWDFHFLVCFWLQIHTQPVQSFCIMKFLLPIHNCKIINELPVAAVPTQYILSECDPLTHSVHDKEFTGRRVLCQTNSFTFMN